MACTRTPDRTEDRLHADATEAYDTLHARVPDDLLAALKEAGVRDWRIWRDGRDVFHVVDCDDYAAMREHLRDHPANLAWQAQVTPLQSTPDDYSGNDDGLPFVWSFARQYAEAHPDERDADGPAVSP